MNPAPTERALLLLDFDGVIADSVTECMAVTWYAGVGPTSDEALAEQFAAIPSTFVERFHALRPYGRTLDDFLVAKRAPADAVVSSQSDFDVLKNAIPSDEQVAFTQIATALRAHWRNTQRAQWLDTHTVFDGIAETLERYAGDVFVITAKDAESSVEILEHFSLAKFVAAVVGEVSDKALAARCLCLGRGVDPGAALFVDDNLTNVSQVQAAGVPSRWATWGWTAPHHRERARELNVVPLSLADLPAI